MTKNGPNDFAQSLAICMKNLNLNYGKEKIEGSLCIFGPIRCMFAVHKTFLSHVASMLRATV
jgi:hypothetical protein